MRSVQPMIAELMRYKRYEPCALGDELLALGRATTRRLPKSSTMLKTRTTAILDGLFSDSFRPTQRFATQTLCHAAADTLKRQVYARVHTEGSFRWQLRPEEGRGAEGRHKSVGCSRLRFKDAHLRAQTLP